MFSRYTVVVLSCLMGAVRGETHNAIDNQSERVDFKRSLSKGCATSYSLTCLKLDIVSWVDKLNENGEFSIYPGVTVVRENISDKANTAEMVAELARDFPNDPNARLDAFLMNKVTDYLSSRSIKVNLFGSEEEADNEDAGTARRRRNKGNNNGMILAAAAMMKGTLMALSMGALAALAGKALMTSMISLVLSAIIGLKSLTSGGDKHSTYEIVSKGHDEHGGNSRYSSYARRSLEKPLPLGLQPEYHP